VAEYSARNNPGRELVFLKCPCCGQSRKLERTGAFAREAGRVFERRPGAGTLAHLNPATEVFVDFRDGAGGRARGFPRIGSLTLLEALQDPRYQEQAQAVFALAESLLKLRKTQNR